MPLETQFLGVSVTNMTARSNLMNEIAYNKAGNFGLACLPALFVLAFLDCFGESFGLPFGLL